jgi:hypothetical protein
LSAVCGSTVAGPMDSTRYPVRAPDSSELPAGRELLLAPRRSWFSQCKEEADVRSDEISTLRLTQAGELILREVLR